MTISVVVCAYTMDRWGDLLRSIQSCFNQSHRPTEVILVVDYNDELLIRAKLELSDVTVVANQSTKGLSGARNTGVARSSGDLIAFLDDDAYADNEWLAVFVRAFEDRRVAGVGGWVVPDWPHSTPLWFPKSFYWVIGCSYEGLPGDREAIRNPIGASMAMRRYVFDNVGGFTSGIGRIGQNQLGCEETELCIRYCTQHPEDYFVLLKESVVRHRVPQERLTLSYFMRRCWAEGLSKAAVASLVGVGPGLAAERRHVAKALPRELRTSLSAARRTPRVALARVALLIMGTLGALGGLLRGRWALRSTTVGPDDRVFDLLDAKAPLQASTREDLRHRRDDVLETSPVTLLQLDLTSTDILDTSALRPGDRVWLELARGTQVLEVVELRAGENGALGVDLLEQKERLQIVESFDRAADSELPSITVVIPTIYRRRDDLVFTVESILASDYPDFNVVLVDNRIGTTTDVLPNFGADHRVRIVRETVPGISSARNRGIATASGEIVAFTDDDAVVDVNWLRALGERFVRQPEVDAVGGMVRPRELDTKAQLWFEEFFGGFTKSFQSQTWSLALVGTSDPLFPYSPGLFAAGCNMAFRSSVFTRFGGFDPKLGTGTPAKGGEDLDKFTQLVLGGATVAFEPAALVRHSHRRTTREFSRQVFSYGVGLTAMYTALVAREPRQLFSLLRRSPLGLRRLVAPEGGRSMSEAPSFPRRTVMLQMLGMAYGPLAYARSAVRARRHP